jgi:hypothetical protein
VLTVVNTTGNYVGNGDPDDSATCPEPSGDTSAGGKQGTLCTFFKYVAGGLQAANKFVSLPLNIKRSLSLCMKDQWTSMDVTRSCLTSIEMVAREAVGPPSST